MKFGIFAFEIDCFFYCRFIYNFGHRLAWVNFFKILQGLYFLNFVYSWAFWTNTQYFLLGWFSVCDTLRWNINTQLLVVFPIWGIWHALFLTWRRLPSFALWSFALVFRLIKWINNVHPFSRQGFFRFLFLFSNVVLLRKNYRF